MRHHEVRFKVYGSNFAELERKAREHCLDYFGCPDFRVNVYASALQTVAGEILTWEGDVAAELIDGGSVQ
jgi:hypothetical protein